MPQRGPLVIAYGNTLRCDDGVGAAVAAQVEGLVPEAHIIVVPQLLPELAEAIAHADIVIFVDATVDGGHGAVLTHRLRAAHAHDAPSAIDHQLTPERMLALALTVFDWVPESYLVSIGGAQFGFGMGLSSEVSAAVPLAVRTVADLIRASGQGSGPRPPAGD